MTAPIMVAINPNSGASDPERQSSAGRSRVGWVRPDFGGNEPSSGKKRSSGAFQRRLRCAARERIRRKASPPRRRACTRAGACAALGWPPAPPRAHPCRDARAPRPAGTPGEAETPSARARRCFPCLSRSAMRTWRRMVARHSLKLLPAAPLPVERTSLAEDLAAQKTQAPAGSNAPRGGASHACGDAGRERPRASPSGCACLVPDLPRAGRAPSGERAPEVSLSDGARPSSPRAHGDRGQAGKHRLARADGVPPPRGAGGRGHEHRDMDVREGELAAIRELRKHLSGTRAGGGAGWPPADRSRAAPPKTT